MQKKTRRRMWRTVVLGVFALAAICYALVAHLEQTPYEVLVLLGIGVISVLVLALAGAVGGYVLFRWRRR